MLIAPHGAPEDRMETALHTTAARRQDSKLHVLGPTPSPSVPTVSVKAVYRLSEGGRKVSLLAGGNGKQRQELVFDVPMSRMHLVQVDANGTARLKLRPRFEVRANQRVVRLDEPPFYDAPPTIDDLLRDAARNHELEATYHAQQLAYRSSRLNATQSWRDQVAESFLSDATQRAVMHPSPTSRRCFINTARGRMEFDAKRDRGIARHVPREAVRRFEADLRARRQRAEDDLVAFHASHSEKQRLIRAWIGEDGTEDQRRRLDAGVLPVAEAVEAMTTGEFRAVSHLPQYELNGAARLQTHLRGYTPFADAVVSSLTLSVATRYLTEATSAQWAVLQEVQAAVPDARVFLRERILSWTAQPRAPRLRVVTVLGFKKLGPITLRREFCVPEMCSPMPESDGGAE
jgi:hypothetical protein